MKPKAPAVMLADPTLLPVTFGGAFGTVFAFENNDVRWAHGYRGVVAAEGDENTAAGAGWAKVTGKATVSPTRSVVLAGSKIPLAELTTVTLAVVSAIFGRALA